MEPTLLYLSKNTIWGSVFLRITVEVQPMKRPIHNTGHMRALAKGIIKELYSIPE
jgi:hypothetical protein